MVANGNKVVKAAKALGIHRDTVSEALKDEDVLKSIDQQINAAAKKVGVDIEFVLGNFKKLTEAQKIISANVILTKSNDPTVRPLKADAKTMDFIEVTDSIAQLRANENIGKILGAYKRDNEKLGDDVKEIRFILKGGQTIELAARVTNKKH